jgi:DNA-binding transcriptional LysR family regulator
MLLGYAQTILRLNEDARLRLSGARHAGRLRVGAGEDLADSWLPGVLRRFRRQYPDVAIELEIGIGTSLFKKLETRELDLVMGGLCNDNANGRSLWKERLVWAFSANAQVPHPLPLAFFPEPCPYRGNGASRAGIDSAAMAHSLHEFESGGGSSGCYGRTGRDAITEAFHQTGSANSRTKR